MDFGRPILLTDVLIPTCADLASLSIDIWTLGEEVDGRRLVVATDISTHSLILHDLVPPPVCRFMKVSPSTLPREAPLSGVGSPTRHCAFFLGRAGGRTQMDRTPFQITVIGRYGSTNARAKIPLGFYYGHTYILPWESELKLMHDPLRGEGEAAAQPDMDQHLAMMVALQEDIQCRLVPISAPLSVSVCRGQAFSASFGKDVLKEKSQGGSQTLACEWLHQALTATKAFSNHS